MLVCLRLGFLWCGRGRTRPFKRYFMDGNTNAWHGNMNRSTLATFLAAVGQCAWADISESNNNASEERSFAHETIVAVFSYSVVGLVLLLNLLIAMMGNSYSRIENILSKEVLVKNVVLAYEFDTWYGDERKFLWLFVYETVYKNFLCLILIDIKIHGQVHIVVISKAYKDDLDVYFSQITKMHKPDDDVNFIKSLIPEIYFHCFRKRRLSLRQVYILEELSYTLFLFTVYPLLPALF